MEGDRGRALRGAGVQGLTCVLSRETSADHSGFLCVASGVGSDHAKCGKWQ